jgi:preprotein translocase subunit SecA
VIEHRDGKIGQTTKEYTGDFTIDEKPRALSLPKKGWRRWKS